MIELTFPGGELPDQPLEVTTAMTVPTLQRCLASLLGNRGGVSMFVAPSWTRLDHGGLIVASYLPGTATPCPSLGPGSLLRVTLWDPFPDAPDQGSSSVKRPKHDLESSRDPNDMARSFTDEGGRTVWTTPRSLVFEAGDHSEPAPRGPSKRRSFRPATLIPDDEQSTSSGEPPLPPVVPRRVLRHERTLLLKAFKREQRFSRRVYRRELRVNFDEEVQAGREGQDADFYPSFGEVEQEAWENYEFDALVIFDEDLISQLAEFRSSLHVICDSSTTRRIYSNPGRCSGGKNQCSLGWVSSGLFRRAGSRNV